jgi:hypothetical protein
MELADDVFAARWLAHCCSDEARYPSALLFVLVAWLSIIFAAFGLFSPHNNTLIFFLRDVCVLSRGGHLRDSRNGYAAGRLYQYFGGTDARSTQSYRWVTRRAWLQVETQRVGSAECLVRCVGQPGQ